MRRSMIARRFAIVGLGCVLIGASARGGDWPEWPFRFKAAPGEPNSLEQVARTIDAIEEKVLDDGTVVLKQPDVYSQSRMTLYRKNFESMLYNAMGKFDVVLSARVFRSDQAAFLSQSNLAAAAATAKSRGRAPSTTTNTTVTPPALISPGTSGGVTPDGLAQNSIFRPQSLTALGNKTSGPFAQGFATSEGTYGLGVEPTVYLDELKRFQDHLNQIRRVNMGDDIADSAGYGLYLIRMPVSIQPGECTLKGHGARLSATVRHKFGTDFLASTFRDLVINDLVDQLSPIVYELIRADALKKVAGLDNLDQAFARYMTSKRPDYLTRRFPSILFAPSQSPMKPLGAAALMLNRVNDRSYPIAPTEMFNVFLFDNIYVLALHAKESLQTKTPRASDVQMYVRRELESAYDIVAQTFGANDPNSAFVVQAYEEKVEEIALHVRNQDYTRLMQDYKDLASILPGEFRFSEGGRPVAASGRESDIRRVAFQQVGRDQERAVQLPTPPPPGAVGLIGPAPDDLPQPLPDKPVQPRPIPGDADMPMPPRGPMGPAVAGQFDPGNSLFQAMTILCYSIAVESGILNDQLRVDMRRVLANADAIGAEAGLLDRQFRADMRRNLGPGGDCCNVEAMRFYAPRPDPAAQACFERYVALRWRIITFALDPAVDQQNIADASSTTRDLQLALAFAFSTGQINFNQLTQFQRRLEVDAETIALNRTVTASAHGNDTFGFRFTPRYQNPPLEKNNLQVITNQLYRGGTGRNYQMNNSKLEAGQRELTAVVIMPSFLHAVNMDVTANWFPLHDPDQMKIPTRRMIEQGRQVVALDEALDTIHDHGPYRPGDVQRLKTRVHQLEKMLPMQTYTVNVPYENTIGGFQLFQEGVSSLVPSLDGFQGTDAISTKSQGTDLFLFGKHFSIQETNVVIGGVYLSANSLNVLGSNQTTKPAAPGAGATATSATATTPITLSSGVSPSGSPIPISGAGATTANNLAIDIISREVLRISIPTGVTPTDVYDADSKTTKPYVEVYVATPTGISNRLLIPWVDPTATSTAPGFSIDSKSALTVNYSLQPVGNGTMKPVGGTPATGSGLTINWSSPLGTAPRAVQVSITFTYKANATIKIPLAIPIVQGSGGKYKLGDPDLQRIAHDFIAEIAKIDPTITLANPLGAITVDSVDIAPDDVTTDNQSVKASGTFTITPKLVNDPLGLRDSARDPSLLRAGYTRPTPGPADELPLPPLPPARRAPSARRLPRTPR